ncbi:MAG: glycerophosphodiester phosphodiesterase family protein [Bacteroidales bacterium]|nr:glycerophosphodiester phosphodiesterase family protein [Bacteroidales bacterium]
MKKTLIVAGLLALGVSAFAQTQQIRAFSHRGGRLERDENTLQAFQESWDAGYTGFETDIRMTKDGVLYMTHDNTLDRTTNGTGIFEEKTSKEIDQLRTKKGNKIMRFEEFCHFLDGKDSLYVEWEFKTSPKESYPQEKLEKYVEMIYKGVMNIKTKGSMMVFTSSDYRGLRYLQEHHPDAKLLLIVSKPINSETIALAKTTGIYTLGCKMDGTSREAVAKAHKEGITVSLWPGKSVEDFMLGAYLGADRMCTDVPLTVMEWVKKNAPWLNVKY